MKRTLRGRLELTYSGKGDDIAAIAAAYVVLQCAQRAMTRLGFTGWGLTNVTVLKPARKRRKVRR